VEGSASAPTTTPEPYNNPKSSATNSDELKLGLGVGLGVAGGLALIAAGFYVKRCIYRQNSDLLAKLSPQTARAASAIATTGDLVHTP
jgi:hypothetical protein